MKRISFVFLLIATLLALTDVTVAQGTDAPPGQGVADGQKAQQAKADRAAENAKINNKSIEALDKKIRALDPLKDVEKIKALKAMREYLKDHTQDDPKSAVNGAARAAKKAVATGDKIQDAGINDYIDKEKAEIAKSLPGLEVKRVTGTGQTTGHIANIAVTNNSSEPVAVRPEVFYIPSDGRYQSYVGRIPEGIVISPRETVTIPVEGYCTDVRKPPVPNGESMPPITEWIPCRHIEPPDPLNPIGTYPTSILPTKPVRPFEPSIIPDVLTSPGYRPEGLPDSPIVPTYPGTDIPVRGTLDPTRDPRTFASIIVPALERIEKASNIILKDPSVKTPFSGNPEKERESVIQQTFWAYSGGLTGERYEEGDFATIVYEQFEDRTGVPVTSLPEKDKEQVDGGVADFWNVFMATGVEAKVISQPEPLPGRETVPSPQRERTVPGAADRSKRCLRFGEDPQITGRGGYDLIGDLFRQGKIPSDFVNDVRMGRIDRKVNDLRAMHASLQNILTNDFNAFPCNDDDAHRDGPQTFPDFPLELRVDLCADNSGKHRLVDFLNPNTTPESLTDWLQQYETSVGNLGLWNPNPDLYAMGFQKRIDRAMEGISEAYQDFESDLHAGLDLRYNRSRAESRLWQAVVTIVSAAVSAGIGAAAGGAIAALSSAFISTTGFVWDQGLQALGADPAAAALASSIITLSMGVSSSWGNGLVTLIEEEVVMGLPSQMLEAGADAMTQERAEGLILAMTMLDDDVWNATIAKLKEDYDDSAIRSFNAKRETLRAEVGRHVASLCEVYNSLKALLPALLAAHENAKRWVHSSYWRELWREAMDASFDCCCEWSDGSPASGVCTFTIPDFGHNAQKK